MTKINNLIDIMRCVIRNAHDDDDYDHVDEDDDNNNYLNLTRTYNSQ